MSAQKPRVVAPPLLHPHPLFPAEDTGEEAPRVLTIHITRHGPQGHRFHARRFNGDELTDLQQIQDAFGGGLYELIGYGAGGVVARRRYPLDGRSLPLNPGAEEEPPAAAAPVPTAAPAAGGTDTALLLGVMQMAGQQQAQTMQAAMSLVAAVMTSGRDQAAAQVAQSQAMFAAQAQSQASIIQAIVSMKQGGGGTAREVLDTLQRGINLGRETAGGDPEPDEVGDLIGMAAPFFAGMGQAASAPPPNGASAPPAGPPSAADGGPVPQCEDG